MVIVYPLRLRCAQPPLPKGEARLSKTAGSIVFRSSREALFGLPCFSLSKNYVTEHPPLALPLGELSPQATERAQLIIKPPGVYGHCLPSPASLRSATSPTGRGKAVENSRQYRFPQQGSSFRASLFQSVKKLCNGAPALGSPSGRAVATGD